MSIKVEYNADTIVQELAALKAIPVAKVIRNAARDFAQAALKATPLGSKAKSEFAKVTDQHGVVHYVHIEHAMTKKYHRRRKVNRKSGVVTYTVVDKPNAKTKKRLMKARLPMRKGWSKASWIGVFRALGVQAREPNSSKLPSKVQTIGTAVLSGGEGEKATATITDDIRFKALGGMTETIVKAGYELASQRIVKEFARMFKQAARGQKPQ